MNGFFLYFQGGRICIYFRSCGSRSSSLEINKYYFLLHAKFFQRFIQSLVVCIFGSGFSWKMKALQQPKKTQKSNFYEGNETTLKIRKRRKESFVVEEDVTDAT